MAGGLLWRRCAPAFLIAVLRERLFTGVRRKASDVKFSVRWGWYNIEQIRRHKSITAGAVTENSGSKIQSDIF